MITLHDGVCHQKEESCFTPFTASELMKGEPHASYTDPRLPDPGRVSGRAERAEVEFFRWKATGVAPRCIKLPNGSLRIRRRDLDAWLAEREEKPAA